MKKQLEYDYDTQVELVNGLCCLHNFIRMEGDGEDIFDELSEEDEAEHKGSQPNGPQLKLLKHTDVTERESRKAKSMRDKIAAEMWEQYKRRIE